MTRISMIRRTLPVLALALAAVAAGCADPAGPGSALAPDGASLAAAEQACWGQATKVFAQMGAMGEHSAQQETPRAGLANLARALYELGVIPEPTMQALGVFVATELGLSIEACGTD